MGYRKANHTGGINPVQGLRHTTATLLLEARVPLAVVQRIFGHSSPTITAGVYGHLDVEDMHAGLEQLSFQPSEVPVADVLPLAVGGPHGAPVVRKLERGDSRSRSSAENPEARGGGRGMGPPGFEPGTNRL